jgi:hypothetical protein
MEFRLEIRKKKNIIKIVNVKLILEQYNTIHIQGKERTIKKIVLKSFTSSK